MSQDLTLDLLKELTEAHGVPGYEAPIRAVVRKRLEPFGELTQDKIGSVICRLDGSQSSPKVMLAGHMDEIKPWSNTSPKKASCIFFPWAGGSTR
jgi:endoglucanase